MSQQSDHTSCDDPVVLRRRLAKALQVGSSLKSKNLMEVEVNKELAKRNEEIRSKNRSLEKQLEEIKDLLLGMERSFTQMRNRFEEEPALSGADVLKDFPHLEATLKQAIELTATTPETPIKPKTSVDPQKPRPKSRRHSTLLNLPEVSGTSLLRKSVNMSMYVSGDSMNSLQFHEQHDDGVHSSTSTIARTPLNPHALGIDISSSTRSSIANSSNTPFQSLQKLGFLPYESTSTSTSATPAKALPETPTQQQQPAVRERESKEDSLPPLFEHFLVIGANVDIANEFALQLKAMEEDSLSNRLKKTFGGILGVGGGGVSRVPSSAENAALLSPSLAVNAAVSTSSAAYSVSNNNNNYYNNTNNAALNGGSGVSVFVGAGNTSVNSVNSNSTNTVNNNNNNVSSGANVIVTSASTSSSSFFGFSRSTSSATIVEERGRGQERASSGGGAAEESARDREREVAAPHAVASPPTSSKSSFMSFFSRSAAAPAAVSVYVPPHNAPTQQQASPLSVESESSQDSPLERERERERTALQSLGDTQSGKLQVHNVNMLTHVLTAPQSEFELFVASVRDEDDEEEDERESGSALRGKGEEKRLRETNTQREEENEETETVRLAERPTRRDLTIDVATISGESAESLSLSQTPTQTLTKSIQSISKFGGTMLTKLNNTISSPDRKVSFYEAAPTESSISSTGETHTQNSVNERKESRDSLSNAAAAVLSESVTEPVTCSEILDCDKKLGKATVSSSLLYRYPPSVAPPPSEVCDFCLPLGAKLHHLSPRDEDSIVQEILFGHSHSKRSSRCFLFVLDDKTIRVDESEPVSEETGQGLGRLYGVCVLVPRLLTSSVVDPTKKSRPIRSSKSSESSSTANTSANTTNATVNSVNYHDVVSGDTLGCNNNTHTQTHTTVNMTEGVYEFESMVCYAFITRFPLFDFFFQVLFDMISLERLHRMNIASAMVDADVDFARYFYDYLPLSIYNEAMQKLSKLSLPLYGQRVQYQLSPDLPQHAYLRFSPPRDSFEYDVCIADWALPTLLSWIDMDVLIWCLSLLLTETQLIVVGREAGMISCAVLGLLSLLKPLEWISPVIPMLPCKLVDFIESPVPIVAGLLLDNEHKNLTPTSLLQKCSTCSGHAVAVFDTDRGEVLLPGHCASSFSSLCLPDAENFFQRLQESGSAYFADMDPFRPAYTQHVTVSGPRKPSYITSISQREEAKRLHGVVFMHINAVVSLGVKFFKQGGIQAVEEDSMALCLEDRADRDEDEDESRPSSKSQELLDYYHRIAHADTSSSQTNELIKAVRQESATLLASTAANTVYSMGSTVSTSSASNAPFAMKVTRAMFAEGNHNKFMKRFTSTQMFQEFMDNNCD